jgi:hypothetical protein
MKSAFARRHIFKTSFEIRSDSSLTNSFSTLLEELPTEKTASVNTLTDYKEKLILKNYRGSYKRVILGIIDNLIALIKGPPVFAIQTFDTIKLVASAKLTVNELYQGYLNGTNDGTGIDSIMLTILDEIKSASIL